MRRFYNFIKRFKRLYKPLLALFLICIFLYGCFKLKSLDHPTTAQSNSYFDVTFVCEHNNPIKTEGRGYFGALLPKGWRAQDYTDFIVHFPTPSENVTGRLCYDQYYTDRLEAAYPAPAEYYWWGGRSIDELEILHSDTNKSDDFTFTFRIYTNDKTGNFTLRYVIGTDGNGENPVSNGKYVDEQRTITITPGNLFPMQKNPNWELLPNRGEAANVKFYSDKDYNGFYTRWYGWTGGDIGRSAPLGDGRSIWVWGDSHTGQVTSGRIRQSSQAQFERNFVILQDGEDFSAFKLLNEGAPDGNPSKIKEMVIPTDDNGSPLGKNDVWYWPQGSTVFYRNGVPELQMLLARTGNDGTGGMWGMQGISADVAIFSLPDLKLKEIKKYKHRTVNLEKGGSRYGMDFGGYVFRDDDGVVYIYGYCDIEGICTRYGLVARVTDGDLTGDWEFYNAQTQVWSTDVSWQNDLANWEKATIAKDPVFVFKDGGKYFGITQPGRCFSENITLYEADSPYGPFKNSKVIGVLPPEISSQNSFFCSLLAIHPQYSKNGELFFSVSKNYQDNKTWYGVPGSADTYLPYFFRVKNWRDKLNISDEKDATDNKGILTAQYDDDIENLTDNSETTIYSASAGSAWIQYESPSSINLRRYTITSANNDPDKDPLHWKLLASNDGVNWTVIDERYYAEFEERLQTVNYNVSVIGDFTYFRLEILATKGGAGLQMAEWQMFGGFGYQMGVAAELEDVSINGKSIPIEDVMNITVLPSERSDIQIALTAKDKGTISGVNSNFTATVDKAGIQKYTIKVVSEDGLSEKEYQLIINSWFAFDDIIKVKWNNTLMLYLNRLAEYNISAYQWYRNDAAMSGETGKSYSAGAKKSDLLDPGSTYYVKLMTPDGELRSEAKSVMLKSMTVQAYPNPVKSGESLTIVADIDSDMLDGASIDIYTMQGNKIHTVKLQGQTTTITMPLYTGVYMLRFKTKNNFEETLKVIVN
ncbi:MAG: DUF5005 domain-containing protein [Prevotella sp.]|jgi:hypothetical protein|nr:DUF5005 domain-containing protein [Prevotella sp.]